MKDGVILNDLVTMDPASIADWIDHVSQERSDLAATFNWLGLAEAARRSACTRDTVPTDERLAWADVTARALEMATSSRLTTTEVAESYEFVLRCSLISYAGASSESPWLDPDRVVSAFLSALDLTLDDAQEMSRDWRRLPREDMLRLRQIKNRLTPMTLIREVLESRSGIPRRDLERWFSLLPQLP